MHKKLSWFEKTGKWLYPEAIFRLDTAQKELYITFDDGPEPMVTPAILDILKTYQAKATFFCLGEKIKQNPWLINKILHKGHAVGNHGFHHINGYWASTSNYVQNAERGAIVSRSNLYRPPYGKITPWQYKTLKDKYKIIFWDNVPGDWKKSFSAEKAFLNLKNNVHPGSIIVLHDSLKAKTNVLAILPKILEYYSSKEYRFCLL